MKHKTTNEQLYCVTADENGKWILGKSDKNREDTYNHPILTWLNYFKIEIDEKTELLEQAKKILER